MSTQLTGPFQHLIYNTPTGFENAPDGFYTDLVNAQQLARNNAEQGQTAYAKLMAQPVAANPFSHTLHNVAAKFGGARYNPPNWVGHPAIRPEQCLKAQMRRQGEAVQSRYTNLSPDFRLDANITFF